MGTANIVREELQVGSTTDGTPLTEVNLSLAIDFATRRVDRNFNKYVGVAKARFKNGSAFAGSVGSGSGNQRWLDVITGSNYSEGLTFFRFQNDGLVAPAPAGIMYVTYYVWFKQQRVDVP